MALASAAILSTVAILIRHLIDTYQLPTLILAFWRDAFVALTLLLALGLWHPSLLAVGRRHWAHLASYGLVLATFNSLYTTSVSINGAAVSTVLSYCSAAFTALLGWWFLRERLTVAKLLAIGLCLSGCVLVARALEPGAWHANVLGIVTGLLSGLLYSLYNLLGRSSAQRGLTPWTTVLYVFGSAAVFLFLLNLVSRGFLPGSAHRLADFLWLGDSLAGWGILLLLAAGPTVFGFGLHNMSLGYLPSSVVNLVLTVEPVLTAVQAYLLLGERMDGGQVFGSLMILAGVVLLRVSEGRSEPHPKPAS